MSATSVSIIVPVYNAEKYLERCVKSILTQTFEDWELILIDDGSPDNSGAICDEYAQNDTRIKVIHKPNGGVASARECGIRNATGVYSIHVDPDDWIEPDMLQILYAKAVEDGSDIVVSDFIFDYSASHQVISRQSVEPDESFRDALFLQHRHGSLCNKLILTELYSKYNLHFPEAMTCWEDLYICCSLLLLHPCRISYVNKAFYHYDLHSNEGSMTRKATMKTIAAMKLFCDYFSEKLRDKDQYLLNELKGCVKVTAYRCNLMSAEDIRNIYPEINGWFVRRYLKSYKEVIFCSTARVINNSSLKSAKRFERINSLYQRIVNKLR